MQVVGGPGDSAPPEARLSPCFPAFGCHRRLGPGPPPSADKASNLGGNQPASGLHLTREEVSPQLERRGAGSAQEKAIIVQPRHPWATSVTSVGAAGQPTGDRHAEDAAVPEAGLARCRAMAPELGCRVQIRLDSRGEGPSGRGGGLIQLWQQAEA